MVLMTLYSSLLKHHLAEELYPATVAGIEYSSYASDKGIVLKVCSLIERFDYFRNSFVLNGFQVQGYNQKLHVIVDAFTKILKTLHNEVAEEKFLVFVQQLFKTYHTDNFSNPAAFAKDLRLSVTEKQHIPLYIKNQCLKTIKFQDFVRFCQSYCDELRITAVMQGNLTKQTAQSIMNNALFNCSPSKVSDVSLILIIILDTISLISM